MLKITSDKLDTFQADYISTTFELNNIKYIFTYNHKKYALMEIVVNELNIYTLLIEVEYDNYSYILFGDIIHGIAGSYNYFGLKDKEQLIKKLYTDGFIEVGEDIEIEFLKQKIEKCKKEQNDYNVKVTQQLEKAQKRLLELTGEVKKEKKKWWQK